MRRYVIRTSKRANPTDVVRLRRAFERQPGAWHDFTDDVEVSIDQGGFRIDMEMRAGARDCECRFAMAWYDAFGSRGSTHVGRIAQESAPDPRTLVWLAA